MNITASPTEVDNKCERGSKFDHVCACDVRGSNFNNLLLYSHSYAAGVLKVATRHKVPLAALSRPFVARLFPFK